METLEEQEEPIPIDILQGDHEKESRAHEDSTSEEGGAPRSEARHQA